MSEVRYAIVYLSVPLGGGEDDEPTETDARAIGEVIYRFLGSSTPMPMSGIELMGTRLTRNNIVAPGLNRLDKPS